MRGVESAEDERGKIPRRDWILLPLTGLLTVAVLSSAVALWSGWSFRTSSTSVSQCMERKAGFPGVHGRPNAVCWDKDPETPLIQYRLNACGYRMNGPCGPAEPGTYRIVAIGSSLVMGQWVPEDSSLTTLLSAKLSRNTGHPVEVYNEGMMSEHPQIAAMRFDEVLAAKPNMILWVLTPYDISVATLDPATLSPAPAAAAQEAPGVMKAVERRLMDARAVGVARAADAAWSEVQNHFVQSSTAVMLQHYLNQSQTRFVSSYLRVPDWEAGFLRAEPSAMWQMDLDAFDREAAQVESQAKAAGLPMVVVLIPNRAEAAMISMNQWPQGMDPYKLGRDVRSIVESHGGVYVDVFREFRRVPNAERFFFAINGHPDAAGHALLSDMLAGALTTAIVPVLTHQASAHPVSTRTDR